MKGFATRHGYGDLVNGQGKQMHRACLMQNSDLEILTQYNQEVRGFLQYYKYVFNFKTLGIIHYIAESSLVKTSLQSINSPEQRLMESINTISTLL